MADQSIQHRPLEPSHIRTRQASASSSDHSITTDDRPTSSRPRRQRINPVARAQQSPSGLGGDHSQRRGSRQISSSAVRERSPRGSSAMTGPMDTDAEVTYTPTTHRVSKARKGKKVHVCEYPGCGKVSNPILCQAVPSDYKPRCSPGRSIASMCPRSCWGSIMCHILTYVGATKQTITPSLLSSAKSLIVRSPSKEQICWPGIWNDSKILDDCHE